MKPLSPEEEAIVEENARYVLGMYDLYKNDHEIEQALYLKGINTWLVPKILQQIKQPAWEKRVRQGKRMAVSGAMVTMGFAIFYYIATQLRDAGTLLDSSNEKDDMLRGTFLVYREVFYFVFFGFILQTIAGIVTYIKYRNLLRKINRH